MTGRKRRTSTDPLLMALAAHRNLGTQASGPQGEGDGHRLGCSHTAKGRCSTHHSRYANVQERQVGS